MHQYEKDTTIVLLLKDRQKFTYRWLDFLDYSEYRGRILISDGSVHALDTDTLKKFSSNIAYSYFGEDKSVGKYLEKIILTLDNVQTKYVMLAANDDFIFFNTIHSLHRILEEKHNYVSAMGLVLDFGLTTQESQAKELSYIHAHQAQIGLEDETVEKRLLRQIEFPSAGWHSLVRTEILREVYKLVLDSGIENYELTVYLADLLVCCFGKVAFVPNELMMMHEIHGDQEAYNLTSFEVRIKNAIWKKELQTATELLSRFSMKVANEQVSSEILSRAFLEWEKGRASRGKGRLVRRLTKRIVSKVRFELEKHIGIRGHKPFDYPSFAGENVNAVRKFLRLYH